MVVKLHETSTQHSDPNQTPANKKPLETDSFGETADNPSSLTTVAAPAKQKPTTKPIKTSNQLSIDRALLELENSFKTDQAFSIGNKLEEIKKTLDKSATKKQQNKFNELVDKYMAHPGFLSISTGRFNRMKFK